MVIGGRLRVLREEKKFTQGEIKRRTGLVCSYISRVENGHTMPAVETLEKFACALEVPMYQLFYEKEKPLKLAHLPKRGTSDGKLWGSSGKEARLLARFCRLFNRMQESDRGLLLFMAQKLATKR